MKPTINHIGIHSQTITRVHLTFTGGKPRLGLYLDVSKDPVKDKNGKTYPRTHYFRTQPTQSKCHLPSPTTSEHLFILNCPVSRATTDQYEYAEKFLNYLGIDIKTISSGNFRTYDSYLRRELTGKTLRSLWTLWVDWLCIGPNGNELSIEEPFQRWQAPVISLTV